MIRDFAAETVGAGPYIDAGAEQREEYRWRPGGNDSDVNPLRCQCGPHVDAVARVVNIEYRLAPYTVENVLLDMRDDLEDRRGLTAITPEAALEIDAWIAAIDKRLARLKAREAPRK